MTVRSATSIQQTPIAQEAFSINETRALIAEYLGVDIERVTDEAHFAYDLGATWLDRLELIIAIEDRVGVELTDDDVERIEVVGDLVRYIEDAKTRGR
jgi:acyl carrier protein